MVVNDFFYLHPQHPQHLNSVLWVLWVQVVLSFPIYITRACMYSGMCGFNFRYTIQHRNYEKFRIYVLETCGFLNIYLYLCKRFPMP